MEIKQLMQEAETLVDNYEFERAISIYKEIILLEGPNASALLGLKDALDTSYRVYINNLISKHPESLIAYMEKLRETYQSGDPHLCIRLCTEALEKYVPNESMILKIRSIRLSAAIKGNNDSYLIDDFLNLWQSYSDKARPHFLLHFLSISNPRLADVFSKLSVNDIFAESLQQLFKQKVEQLLMFQSVFDIT